MAEYDVTDEDMMMAAQSCKSFKTRKSPRGGYGTVPGSISCSICARWNGSKCSGNAFENVLSGMEWE